jgi:hypothetical protein
MGARRYTCDVAQVLVEEFSVAASVTAMGVKRHPPYITAFSSGAPSLRALRLCGKPLPRKEKAPGKPGGFLVLIWATSYSPTHSRAQYHRG